VHLRDPRIQEFTCTVVFSWRKSDPGRVGNLGRDYASDTLPSERAVLTRFLPARFA